QEQHERETGAQAIPGEDAAGSPGGAGAASSEGADGGSLGGAGAASSEGADGGSPREPGVQSADGPARSDGQSDGKPESEQQLQAPGVPQHHDQIVTGGAIQPPGGKNDHREGGDRQ